MFKKLKLLLTCPLSSNQRCLLKELQNYNISCQVQKDYTYKIKNNLDDTYKTIKKKLIRNVILGNQIRTFWGGAVYQYGNLEIWVDFKEKEICNIRNNKGKYLYTVNVQDKKWLNEYLGIEQEEV